MNKTSKLLILTLIMSMMFSLIGIFVLTSSAAEESATLSFASTAQRTSFSTTKQVWEQNGITFTNDKASSTSNVADYSNPVRLYAKSSITIECSLGNITKIEVVCDSSSYATALKTSVGSEAAASGSTVTITPTASAESYTVAKLSAQVRVKSLTVFYDVSGGETPSCEHTNTTTITVDATCTEEGSVTVICNDCGETVSIETIDAPGHSFNDGIITEAPSCETSGTKQYTCNVCGDTETEEVAAIGHNYVGGTCENCGESQPTEPIYIWELVTDVNDLKVGDKIVIVANGYNYALSTTQNSNNRGQASVVKSDNTITFGDDVQIITLEAGTVDSTFAFYTGSGYLYAASNSNNYLRTKTALDANGSWKITISNGVATIVAQGSFSRNTMQYNQSSGLFSCYGSATQKPISIYKQVEQGCTHENVTTETVDATCTTPGSVTKTCTDCGEVTVEEISKLGHDIIIDTAVAPTCTEPGLTEGSHCSRCDEATVAQEVVEALGHNWLDATCEAPKTCSGCGLTEGEALGHDIRNYKYKAPTCLEEGYEAYEDCTRCDYITKVLIPALGHNFVNNACQNCGIFDPESIDYSGRYYIATIRPDENYTYMTSNLGTASTNRYQGADSGLSVLPKSICESVKAAEYVFVFIKNDDGTYKIYAESVNGNNYIGWTSGNSGTLVAKEDALALSVDRLADGTFNIYFIDSDGYTRYLSLNNQSANTYYAFYTSNQKRDLSLIPVGEHNYVEGDCTGCDDVVDNATELQVAINQGGTVKLWGNIVLSEIFKSRYVISNTNVPYFLIVDSVYAENKLEVTLDLNGYTITVDENVTDNGHLLLIGENGIFTFTDSGATNGYTEAGASGSVVRNLGGEVTITGGVDLRSKNYTHYTVYTKGGTLTIEDAVVDSGFGCVQIVGGATATINGGQFYMNDGSNNPAANQQNIVYVESAKLSISNGHFESMISIKGAAVVGEYEAEIFIENGYFKGPSMSIQSRASSTLNVLGGEFYGSISIKGDTGTGYLNIAAEGGRFDDPSWEKYISEDVSYVTLTSGMAAYSRSGVTVGTIYYVGEAALAKAIAEANYGDIITLKTNYSLSGSIAVPEGKNIIINLNGYEIDGSDITVNGILSFDDSLGGSVSAHILKGEGGCVTNAVNLGNVMYMSFDKAYAVSVNGDTITLLSDVELPEGFKFDKNITLCLNGCELTNPLGDFAIENYVADGYFVYENAGGYIISDTEIEIPEETPDIDVPEIETPDVDVPEIETPDIELPEETPETQLPDTEEIPDTNEVPDGEIAGGSQLPEINETAKPEVNKPESNINKAESDKVVKVVAICTIIVILPLAFGIFRRRGFMW